MSTGRVIMFVKKFLAWKSGVVIVSLPLGDLWLQSVKGKEEEVILLFRVN